MYNVELLYETLGSFFHYAVPLKVGEVVLDRFPLFLGLPYPTVINTNRPYFDRFNTFYESSEDGDALLFNLLHIAQNYKMLYNKLIKYKGSCDASTWAKFVECVDFISTPDIMDSMKIYRDVFSINRIPTDILLSVLDDTKYFRNIYNKIRDCAIVTSDVATFISEDYFDVLYCDFSYYVYKQSVFENITKPTIVVARPDVYTLNDDNWTMFDCGSLVVYYNHSGVI